MTKLKPLLKNGQQPSQSPVPLLLWDIGLKESHCLFYVGDTKFSVALETLKIFDGRLVRLQEEYDRIRRAKEALDLEPQVLYYD